MIMSRPTKIALVLTIALSALVVMSSNVDRAVRLVNGSGSKVEVYWIDVSTRNAVLMSTPFVYDGADFPINSFVGHEFEVRELPSSKTGTCASPDNVCRVANFVVSESDNQLIKIMPGLELKISDSVSEARDEAAELIQGCRVRAKAQLEDSPGESLRILEDLASCVEGGVARKLEKANQEISFQAKIRTDMAGMLENYTCVDDSVETSPDLRQEVWSFKGVDRLVHVKHERSSSRIHVIENFIDEEECQAMADEAAKTLHRATVADGKGGSRLSENRKAMQAGIAVNWKKEDEGDPIARISRRVYDYTEHVLGLGIKENGQEDLMSIQYFGRGRNDTEPDRYTPHCDGDCTGLPHKPGTRMATMVMYCTLPTEGGATNFRNAGVHIKPVAGNGIFFSYIDPVTKVMDTGFTEHSGCPVYEGEKKIVTQWIRYGVDDENPWNSFNTLGIKIKDAADQ